MLANLMEAWEPSYSELEKYYSNNCNIKLDIKIFFKTFSAVTGGHGAGV